MREIVASIVIFILGLLLFVIPELVLKKSSFDAKGGEPTEGYIIFFRFIGIFWILVGIVLFIVYIVK